MNHVNQLLRSVAALSCLVGPVGPSTLRAQSGTGIPEPGLVLYGRVLDRQTGQTAQANSVVFQVTGNGETASVAASAVNFSGLNGQLFYVTQVPFETRLAGAEALAKTPNTLALTTANTLYSRVATVNGQPASFKSPGASQFAFGAAERGRIERLDLEVEGIPLAGPDPGSELRIRASLKPLVQNGALGGINFEWASVPGKTYSIYRSNDLSKPFEKIGSVPATLPTASFTDAGAAGLGPFFYRLALDP